MRPSESRNSINTIRRYATNDARVIFGTAYDGALGDQLRLTLIATGLSSVQRKAKQRPEQRHDQRHYSRHDQCSAPPLNLVQRQHQQPAPVRRLESTGPACPGLFRCAEWD